MWGFEWEGGWGGGGGGETGGVVRGGGGVGNKGWGISVLRIV